MALELLVPEFVGVLACGGVRGDCPPTDAGAGVVAGELIRAGELLAGGVFSCGPAEITALFPSKIQISINV